MPPDIFGIMLPLYIALLWSTILHGTTTTVKQYLCLFFFTITLISTDKTSAFNAVVDVITLMLHDNARFISGDPPQFFFKGQMSP